MNTNPSTVAVLGPGGVGGLAAALLARAGHRVVCLAGPDTTQALRTEGLTVRSNRFGDFTVPVKADTQLRDQVDVCLVAVKETALSTALNRVDPRVLGSGLVVPLLNGIDHLPPLRARYRAERVIAATIKVESTKVAPGRIEHTSPFAAIELAVPVAPAARAGLDHLAVLLEGAGFSVSLRRDETAMLWDKLCFLAPMALLTTRYGATVGDVRARCRPELLTLIREITSVARAAGGPVDAARILAMFDQAPAAMKSSMQRDAEAGRPLELDAIGGSVLRAAEAHGVETPTLAQIVTELGADLRGKAAR
ncbi:2-dehydropantoate 2-reductase [Streptomyces sp. DT2A-34]|uniref:ketopantoate reductase family protein n=1 Tax=Streptomyces sp. DT2A-34 TaxID=3051182 RepID=UPI00265BE8A7|nr:2-dehydropantoate 2-reductase [Streptomyces sp. DT2A-34]MDO0916717.1 2-dehydropantoate 2-reductase [Streptomyces sp. DT2A-34]